MWRMLATAAGLSSGDSVKVQWWVEKWQQKDYTATAFTGLAEGVIPVKPV